MKILVTGATGMLGRHVVEACKAKGWDTVGVGNVGHVQYSDGSWSIPGHDLLDIGSAWFVCNAYVPSVLVHCAGRVGGIGRNSSQPYEQGHANALMGMNIIEAAQKINVKHLINIGSCCQYPADASLPLREDDMWNGYPHPTNGPYGIAKRFVCDLARAAHEQYDLGYTNLILANLYGPHDNFDLETSHVIPALIRKFVEAAESGAESVALWGDGQAYRDFLYVKDAASVIVHIIENGPQNTDINVPNDNRFTECRIGLGQIHEWAKAIAEMVGFTGRIDWDTSKPSGQRSRWMCNERLRRVGPGWLPDYTPRDGLKETIEWFKANRPQS